MLFLFVCLPTVDFQWGVHESHVEGLAPGPLQLLAVRRVADRTALRTARRPPVLRQVLRDGVRQQLRRLQPYHRHRLEGELGLPRFLTVQLSVAPTDGARTSVDPRKFLFLSASRDRFLHLRGIFTRLPYCWGGL